MAKTLYAELADTLKRQIGEGQFPVGSVLPSEVALSTQHGISRFTARAALATLERQGYLKRRARVGTVVVAQRPQTAYSVQANSASDILRFAEATDLHLVHTRRVDADAVLARDLGCAPGEAWIKVAAYRTSPETGSAVSWTDYYLHHDDPGVAPLLGPGRTSLRHLLDILKGYSVERIEQQIEACAIPREEAATLGVPARSPAIRVVYRSFSAGGPDRSYVAICLYPAGRFRMSQTLLRDV